jgi:hypothetical protein
MTTSTYIIVKLSKGERKGSFLKQQEKRNKYQTRLKLFHEASITLIKLEKDTTKSYQTEFNNIFKRLFTLIKLDSPQGCKYGSTNTS